MWLSYSLFFFFFLVDTIMFLFPKTITICAKSPPIYFESVKHFSQIYNLGSTVLLFYLCQTSRSIIILRGWNILLVCSCKEVERISTCSSLAQIGEESMDEEFSSSFCF